MNLNEKVKMKTIEYPKYQYIEYPLKEWVSFSDMGDGRCRLHCELEPSHREYLYPDKITTNTKKRWGDLDRQINKFIEEDGRFIITYESYFPEYYLPMVVFPNPYQDKEQIDHR